MHPSAPSFSVTLDAQLLQLTVSISYPSFLCPVFSYTKTFQIPLASLPLKLHPIPSMAKGSLVSFYQCVFHVHFLTVVRSQMQLSQASALISESLIPRGRADLSTVIAFVNRNILPTPQDTPTKAKDFAWFALRPLSGAHVCHCTKGFLSDTAVMFLMSNIQNLAHA
jgi:hypothetical protein